MAATATAHLAQVFGSTLKNAFKECGTQGIGPQNLDLIQIVNPGVGLQGTPICDINVDFAGVVHNPAVNPTNGTRLGVFFSFLPNGSTTAQFFQTAFANPSNLDIIQSINEGGNVTYFLNYQGVASGS